MTTQTLHKKAQSAHTVKTSGPAYDVRLLLQSVTYCDGTGAHTFSLEDDKVLASHNTCTSSEKHSGCPDSPLDVTVRTPDMGPIDIIDADGSSYPLKGRVHDCAILGTSIIASTGSNVVFIDTTKQSIKELSAKGGDRVAISPEALAWTDQNALSTVPR